MKSLVPPADSIILRIDDGLRLECFTLALSTPDTNPKRERGECRGSSLTLRVSVMATELVLKCAPEFREKTDVGPKSAEDRQPREFPMKRSIVLSTAIVAFAALFGWPAALDRMVRSIAEAVVTRDAPDEGTQLPRPDPAFKGKVGETYKDSTPSYPQPVKAPKGSPNVLLILLDDVGFGMCSTFGGPVPTPHLDKLAGNGLEVHAIPHHGALLADPRGPARRPQPSHVSAPASSSRWAPAIPGYTGIIPLSCGLVSQTLRDNGYATGMFGKWHNTPGAGDQSGGPFDRWPTGLGFEYFYGFNQGETNQYYPTLYRNTTPVPQPKTPEQGYHFTADMTDEAIAWTRNVRAADRDKPWFVYFSTSGVHAPHHAPKDWRDKYKGKFDHGWDKQRRIDPREAIGNGHHPQGHEAHPATRGDPGVGFPAGGGEEGLQPADGELRGLHGLHRRSDRPADRQPSGVRRAG